MGIIGPAQSRLRPQYAHRLWLGSPHRGQIRAVGWPRTRPRRRGRYEAQLEKRFRDVQAHVKTLKGFETEALRQGVAGVNKANTGQRGSASIRFRDLLHQLATGRLWGFELPDGRVIHSAAAHQDQSEAMDWTEPRLGSLLVRTEQGWLPTHQCQPGYVLTCSNSEPNPHCCPPASLASPDESLEPY